MGLVSSLIGLGLGVLAALGLEALLSGFGVTLPSGPIVFEPRTVIVCLLVGVGVTVVSAISPARRAVRIPPVAAVSEQQTEADISLRRRFTWGSAITLAGVAALAYGLTKPVVALVGLGAVLIFIGVARLAPAVARPMSSVHRPSAGARVGHVGPPRTGELHAQPAPDGPDCLGTDGRSGARVGYRGVRRIAVEVGHQQRRQCHQCGHHRHHARTTRRAGSPTPSRRSPQPCPASPPRRPSTRLNSSCRVNSRVSPRSRPRDHSQTVILNMTEGSSAALAAGELLIDTTTANSKHLAAGDVVPVKFAKTGRSTMRIGGVFKANALIGSYLVGDGFFLTHFSNQLPVAVLLRTDGSAGVDQQVKTALGGYPNLEGADEGPVRAVATGPGQPIAGLGLRAARSRRDHRADRDRQHLDAVGLRADP